MVFILMLCSDFVVVQYAFLLLSFLFPFLHVRAAVKPLPLKNGIRLSLTIWQLGKNNLSILALAAVALPSSKRL
jgi:hypothetical protein